MLFILDILYSLQLSFFDFRCSVKEKKKKIMEYMGSMIGQTGKTRHIYIYIYVCMYIYIYIYIYIKIDR